jgi:hypothetical protein
MTQPIKMHLIHIERKLQREADERWRTPGYIFQKALDCLYSKCSSDQSRQTTPLSYPKGTIASEVEMVNMAPETDSDTESTLGLPPPSYLLERIDTPELIDKFSLTPSDSWEKFMDQIH